jgi:hypothetical protein
MTYAAINPVTIISDLLPVSLPQIESTKAGIDKLDRKMAIESCSKDFPARCARHNPMSESSNNAIGRIRQSFQRLLTS